MITLQQIEYFTLIDVTIKFFNGSSAFLIADLTISSDSNYLLKYSITAFTSNDTDP